MMRAPAPLTLTIALLLPACGGAEPLPGELFEGVIEAPVSVATPLSHAPVCVAGVRLWTRSDATKKGSTTTTRARPRWAEGATLTVGDEKLRIIGDEGSPVFAEQGDTWQWERSAADDEALRSLRGWGFDATLDALTDPAISSSYTHVEAREVFTRCGEPLTLRALRVDDRLELVDANPTESANALGLFAKIAAGFLMIFVLPVVALIVFVVRRARRSG